MSFDHFIWISSLILSDLQHPLRINFQASRKLCDLIKAGVAGIFGPVAPVSSNHVQSVGKILKNPQNSDSADLIDRSGDGYPPPSVHGDEVGVQLQTVRLRHQHPSAPLDAGASLCRLHQVHTQYTSRGLLWMALLIIFGAGTLAGRAS